MPRVSAHYLQERREEIIAACARLYETMSFKDITIKEIGKATSFTRTSIYNYFRTKEEIFLALMQREYEAWTADLNALADSTPSLTRDGLAQAMARSLEKRKRLLKLLSMNHFDMEENSRYENLTAFKFAYGNSIKAVDRCLITFGPEMTEAERSEFLYAFFPFLFGIYPYVVVTDEQRRAMEEGQVGFREHTVYDITYHCLRKLLGSDGAGER